MIKVTDANYDEFVLHPLAVLYFDAPWSNYKNLRDRFRQVASQTPNIVFGEVDIQAQPNVGKTLNPGNVPGLCYFRNGVLSKMMIGDNQEVLTT